MMSDSAASACTYGRTALLTVLTLGLCCAGMQARGSQDNPDNGKPKALEAIEVIGITPLHGIGLDKDKFPTHIQTARSEDLRRSQNLDLTDFLNQDLGSVHINEAQNNPLQPNVQFRGFTASPLLGLPQGLAVYQDGVRINEPFGDTVNFDLIPKSSIASINLLPGSNPLFGLNALGGALSIKTKNGFTHPGTRAEAYGGSFGRYRLQAESGGNNGRFGYFITANYFDENGYRDFSPSIARQLFGNLSWRGEDTSLDLNLNIANTDLIGNGALPEQLLDQDRQAIFTRPDQTENQLTLINLKGSRFLSDNVSIDGNAYYRRNEIDTLNGDDSDFAACQEPDNAALLCSDVEEEEGDDDDDGGGEQEEEVVMDADSDAVQATDAVEGGTVNTSETVNESTGAALQLTFLNDLFARENQLVLGTSVDYGDVEFESQTELGTLDDTRLAIGSGILDGSSFVGVDTNMLNYSVFFTDTWSATEALAVTFSGRYNHTDIDLDDQLGEALNGNHDYERFNPAIGAVYTFSPIISIYGNYSESNRAPTPVELTCADPNDPCRLPNAFLADPPLDDVVARTWEGGVRGRWQGVNWSLGVFNTLNKDDIIFNSAGQLTNQGFFDNVGDTRRRGVELNLNGVNKGLTWSINYTYLEAEFRDDVTVASENNPFAVDGEIQVESGDRLPTEPRNLLKATADYRVLPKLSVGGDLLHNSNQVLRGDESNQLDTVAGYTVVNLRTQYHINDHVVAFARVDNVLNTDYETFGLLGEADEVLGDDFDSPVFLSPGAGRGAWAGLRVAF